MARGLFSNWKQPVFVHFDTKITKEILDTVITELYKINYNVVACVSDCGGGNVGLWKVLNCGEDKSYFQHPETNKNIYMFADAPHLLKLIRNWFIDTGFKLSDGSVIKKHILEALLEKSNTEISVSHKLNRNHLDCERAQRQNVALAAQLLSHTSSTVLLHFFPGNEEALAAGKFIETVSIWFDIMNSYSPSQTPNIKKPYGLFLSEQDEALDTMYITVKTMRCLGKGTLQIFQKGILMSISSLRGLYSDMKEMVQCKFLLTHRLNQDSLESFFSQIRSRGGLHDHPSPVTAIQRIRLIVLGKNPGFIQDKTNILPTESNEEYLMAKVISSCGISVENASVNKSEDENITTSFSSDSSSSRSSPKEKSNPEVEGFHYLCGWIAKKFKNKYPHFGTYTGASTSHHNYAIPSASWLQHLSFGGLTEPSSELVEQLKKADKVFCKFHKDGIREEKGVVKLVVSKSLKKNIVLPEEILKAFVLQRTYIRIKRLNEQETSKKRKRSLDAENRKTSKKIRKIVN